MNYDLVSFTQRVRRRFLCSRGTNRSVFIKIYGYFRFVRSSGKAAVYYLIFYPVIANAKVQAWKKKLLGKLARNQFQEFPEKKDCRKMIYVFFEDLTLSDNQLLRGEEISRSVLPKKKKRILLVCHLLSRPNFFFQLVKLIVCSSPEAPQKNKV